mmetsp:Transcript_12495/g.30714  ORF Transcript_12495/g.30714 Transcript_12495/m.30714 type:complete len:221 (-) Transcript_12495:490-1152(-)
MSSQLGLGDHNLTKLVIIISSAAYHGGKFATSASVGSEGLATAAGALPNKLRRLIRFTLRRGGGCDWILNIRPLPPPSTPPPAAASAAAAAAAAASCFFAFIFSFRFRLLLFFEGEVVVMVAVVVVVVAVAAVAGRRMVRRPAVAVEVTFLVALLRFLFVVFVPSAATVEVERFLFLLLLLASLRSFRRREAVVVRRELAALLRRLVKPPRASIVKSKSV